ncbi:MULTISPECIES: M48 family metallopeptidase [Priestia]|uniref:M48 family metallopeptidase n=1 Tax=Priestia TaxID=2800373 RepID=UPI0027AA807D|nr:M48 family metallopeptidase [Priestia megaterium]WDC89157.1 M48 family metallopeptidase [Priestia megaterium]
MNAKLIHENEKIFFILCMVISLLTYLFLIISLVGILYIAIGFFITFMLHGFSIAQIRNNGVRLTEKQFPHTYHQAKHLSSELDLELPDIYIVQSGGLLNAFATRFFGRHFVVLYSDIVEMIEDNQEKELSFIIAHELVHIKRKHTLYHSLILPALWVPFLGKAYSRACEYTCDRTASVAIGDAKAATQALTILAVGHCLNKKVNQEEFVHTHSQEKGFFMWLNQATSTHPPIAHRIKEINYLAQHPELFDLDSNAFQTNEIA